MNTETRGAPAGPPLGGTLVPGVPLLPPDLVARGFSWRAESESDAAFLEQLYVAGRWVELAPTGWPDATKLAFLRDQAALQRRHYATHYDASGFAILEQSDTPAGRLALQRGADELRIVDIALLPAWRNQGIGTALLRGVLAEGAASGVPVTIHVEQFNPAQRLYRRLGFREVREQGPYWLMECRPESVVTQVHS